MKLVLRQAFCAVFSLVSFNCAAAADVLPKAEPQFKGKIAVSTKDSVPDWPQPVKAPKGAPNIVLILLDDVGFGATTPFGGPVETPELSRLANQGLRYNRFHVAALCSPTRAALLSGRNDHNVGFGSAVEFGGYPGYNGIWPKSAVSVADVLRRNGYSTAAFGKWHNTPSWETSPVGPFDHWPTGLGFEYFYGFMHASDSQWEPALYRNTIPVAPPKTAEQGYQLTTDLADDAINWVRTHDSLAPDKPFFLYFATGATHHPIHVAPEWIDKYRGKFDQGWDKLRAEIFARQKKMGVIPANAELTPRPKELPGWNSLSADEKKLVARQMEVYAGYLAQTDFEVGRMIKAVQQGPNGDNTLILYIVGDNGASGEAGVMGVDGTGYKDIKDRLRQSATLGGPQHMGEQATNWAWALSSPFQWMKTIASHFGGTRDPLVVSWPARIKDHGGLRSQFTHVNDVAATLYEVTGIRFPSTVDGVAQRPLDGVSFADSFTSPAAPSHHKVQIWEQLGHRAIYKDGWIAGARHSLPWEGWAETNNPDYSQDIWELYHIDEDFSQAHDLAGKLPRKLKEMQDLFDVEARQNNIYPLFGADTKGTPNLTKDRNEFVFYPGLTRLLSWVAPDFDRSHRITADVVIPDQGAEGVILSNGARFGGFVLYVKDNRLVYENNFFGSSSDVLTSTIALPRGKVQLTYELTVDKSSSADAVRAQGRLYINGQPAGENTLVRIPDKMFHGTFEIGEARVSPVSKAYSLPFKFTGTLEKVKVEMK